MPTCIVELGFFLGDTARTLIAATGAKYVVAKWVGPNALIIFGLEIVFLFRYSFFFVSLHLCVNSGRLPFSLQRRVILLVNDYSVGTEGFGLDRDIFWSGKSHMIGRFLTISDWLMGTQG